MTTKRDILGITQGFLLENASARQFEGLVLVKGVQVRPLSRAISYAETTYGYRTVAVRAAQKQVGSGAILHQNPRPASRAITAAFSLTSSVQISSRSLLSVQANRNDLKFIERNKSTTVVAVG